MRIDEATHRGSGEPSLWRGALSGAVAGAAAGWLMETAQTHVMPRVKQAVQRAQEGVQEVTARHESETLPAPEREPPVTEVHHALGEVRQASHPRAEVVHHEGHHQQLIETHAPEQAQSETGASREPRTDRERARGQAASKQGEHGSGGGGSEPATTQAAEAVSERVLGHELEGKNEKKTAGRAAHYGMSITTGLIYGVAAEYDKRVTMGHGTAYGAAVWAVADEMVVPALGFSKPPTQHPPSTHAYALASHLVYGAALETFRGTVRSRV